MGEEVHAENWIITCIWWHLDLLGAHETHTGLWITLWQTHKHDKCHSAKF